MINLKVNPFFLDDEAEKWVYDTLAKMDDNDKIGQIFCLESISGEVADIVGVNHDESRLKTWVNHDGIRLKTWVDRDESRLYK